MVDRARGHAIANGLDYIAMWQVGMYNPEVDMRESMRPDRSGERPRSPTSCR
jgi:hypothetical protein